MCTSKLTWTGICSGHSELVRGLTCDYEPQSEANRTVRSAILPTFFHCLTAPTQLRARRGRGGGDGVVLEEAEDDDVPVTVDDADEEDQVDDLA